MEFPPTAAIGLAGIILCFGGCELFRRLRNGGALRRLAGRLAKRRALRQVAFVKRMRLMRIAIICAGSLCLPLAVLLPRRFRLEETAWVQPLLFIAVLVATAVCNNMAVKRYWRCPRCAEPLPRSARRGGLAPILVVRCPHCGARFG